MPDGRFARRGAKIGVAPGLLLWGGGYNPHDRDCATWGDDQLPDPICIRGSDASSAESGLGLRPYRW